MLEERRNGEAHKTRDAREMQGRPGRGHRRPGTGAPNGQATPEGFADGQRGARAEGAVGKSKDAQGRSAGDHHAGAGGETGAWRTREGRGTDHDR